MTSRQFEPTTAARALERAGFEPRQAMAIASQIQAGIESTERTTGKLESGVADLKFDVRCHVILWALTYIGIAVTFGGLD